MCTIRKTQSLCPICQRPVEAEYDKDGDRAVFVQHCPEHGEFRTLASESAEDLESWIRHPVINIPPKTAQTKGDPLDKSCPLHCGTCENHLQTACCVLIDVTNRCNQHCPYCFAVADGGEGEDLSALTDEERMERFGEPSLREMERKFDLLLDLGEERPFNIQISGGEPTVREDLPQIIAMAREKGFEYIQLNTNGRRLGEEPEYAQTLKDAGTSVVFMQFDGTRDDIYEKLRGEPLLEVKTRAIRNCERAGLAVTLVPTITKGFNDDNIGEMMDFLVENVNVVKGIHFQPVSFFGRHPEKAEGRGGTISSETGGALPTGDYPGRITMFGLLRELEKQRPEFAFEDFLPISTGHPLCCFYSTYIREPDGSVRCTLTRKDREEGVSCCDTVNPGEAECCGGAAEEPECCCESVSEEPECCCESVSKEPECCCDAAEGESPLTIGCCGMTEADQLEVIRRDRDYVLNKWDIAAPEESGCGCSSREPAYSSSEEITDLDEFLTYYRRNTFTVTGMAFQDLSNLDAERLKRCRVQQLTDDDRLVPFCAYNTIYRK